MGGASSIDRAQAMMTEETVEEMLRSRAGIDPVDLTALLDVLAIGITNSAWRNTCVEDWHGEGRLSDGDMMRVNSHTTHGVRQRLRGWAREHGIRTGTREGLAGLTVEDADALGYRLFRWLTNPERKLPTGATLRDLARTEADLDEYVEEADRNLRGFVARMENNGVRFGLLFSAAHGALACTEWWGHPSWPTRVDQFVAVLDNPADHPYGPKEYERLRPEPAGMQDRSALRAALMRAPWELDSAIAEWLIDAGIGCLRIAPDVPGGR
ncbi:hypothetical protein [Kitasatospora sp. NPDC085464]|uniref:hypothetical protein n=1 Tax=Kitasatospora sp. NPDC085464 TaxID=3364063 RepID=UPI0037CBB6A8